MNPGDSILIKAVVLRVDGNVVHAQTATGHLILTDASNCMSDKKQSDGDGKTEKPRAEKKSDSRRENKSDSRGIENKQAK